MARGRLNTRSGERVHRMGASHLKDRTCLRVVEGFNRKRQTRHEEETVAKHARYGDLGQIPLRVMMIFETAERLRWWVQYCSRAGCQECGATHRHKMDMTRLAEHNRKYNNTIRELCFQ